MSNHPTARPTSTYRPTATFPVRRPILPRPDRAAPGRPAAYPATAFAGWRDATPTELLPTVGRPAPSRRERPASTASTAAGMAFPRVSTLPEPTRGRVARRTAPTRTKVRHLRSALTGLLIAAALLTGLQLYAAAGISSARQAALTQRDATQTGQAAPMPDRAPAAQPDVRSDIQPDWVTETAHAAYDRTDPAASPLYLPRCTTSPDTSLPCLATISPDSKRAVVLEEDASLTPLTRR